jgi:hypothetical protein
MWNEKMMDKETSSNKEKDTNLVEEQNGSSMEI